MRSEPYDPERHLPILVSWWEHYDVIDRIDLRTISPFGAVVVGDDGPLMAGWVYLSLGCEAAFIERVYARPGNTPATSREAGGELLAHLEHVARTHGYSSIFSHVERPALVREMEQCGFASLGPGTILVKGI